MKPLSSLEIKLCQKQGKIFESSVNKTNYSSPIFIRRFMYSSIAKIFDDKTYLFTTISEDETFDILDVEYGESDYGIVKYTEDQMYWIGYIYRCLSIKYDLSSKSVFKLFKGNEIVRYYNICHTFDIVDAAERMMESIHYNFQSIEEKAYNIMKRLIFTEKLYEYLGKEVDVIIDRPVGYNHNGIIYEQNYGYIDGFKSLDEEDQDVYVLDADKPIEKFTGKVIAIVNRKDDVEDKLVVSAKDKKYSKKEILDKISFQEKYFKSKIITSNNNLD